MSSEEMISFVFFSILVSMATNDKSTASEAIYARSSFFHMEKVSVSIGILNSPFKMEGQ